MIPTRRLAALTAVTAPVWLLSDAVTLPILVTGLVVLVVLADALTIPGHEQLQVDRVLPGTLDMGDPRPVEYQILSRWPLLVTVEVHDPLSQALEREAEPSGSEPWLIGRVRLPPGARAVLAITVIGRERGAHSLGRFVLRVRGVLGLVQRTLGQDAPAQFSVVPSFGGVRRYRLLALQHRLREAGIRNIRRRGDGTSFANLREYVEGDDPRHMDWKASARRARLITREYTVEQGQTIIIAIDAGRMMTQLVGETARFEYALASASVLADVATRSGDHVALMVFNDEVRAFVPPAKGALALRRIREAMLPLTARMVEPDYASAFRTLSERYRKRSLVVLFTDLIDPRSSRALIAHTTRCAVRHLPLVVALRNDELVGAALPEGSHRNALFESAAAEELLLEREEALARMRQGGVSVLDVSPTVMTAAVVNRYVALKARAAL